MQFDEMSFTPARVVKGAALSPLVAAFETTTSLTARDRLGAIRVRWGIGRDDYRVAPGLYACGNPDESSPVLVTANYKLTFDSVRKELSGLSVWILALDTKGVNVWCAAGKGTFGTEELLRRIRLTNLDRVVRHRDLVLPQLGASGVAGWKVSEESGFRVHFGPVYARDIPEYLAAGMRKTDAMRRVAFTLPERMAVAPVEVAHSAGFAAASLLAAFLLALPSGDGFAGRLAFTGLSLVGGIFAGTVVFPALLPILPFRAFAAKGAALGFLWTALAAWLTGLSVARAPRESLAAALGGPAGAFAGALFLTVPLVSYLAMNFTGSSTFTCQKGAELEVKIALPAIVASLGVGLIVSIAGLIARIL